MDGGKDEEEDEEGVGDEAKGRRNELKGGNRGWRMADIGDEVRTGWG